MLKLIGGIDPEKLYRATLSNIYLTSSVNVYFLAHVFTNLKEVPAFPYRHPDLKTPLVRVKRKRYPKKPSYNIIFLSGRV